MGLNLQPFEPKPSVFCAAMSPTTMQAPDNLHCMVLPSLGSVGERALIYLKGVWVSRGNSPNLPKGSIIVFKFTASLYAGWWIERWRQSGGGSTHLYFPHLFVLSVIAALSKGKNQMPKSVIFKVKTHSPCLDKKTFSLSFSTLRTGHVSTDD